MTDNEFSIFRPLANEEKEGLTVLGRGKVINVLTKFLAELAKVNSKYQKMYQPFDSYSARIEFEEAMSRKKTELNATLDKSKINPKIDFGNLDEYGDPHRFDFEKQTDVLITKLVAGIKNEVEIGKRYHFIGKQRGNKFSMFVPEEDVEKVKAWVNKTYKVPGKKEVEVEKEE